jgi:hypothetical protein
VLKPLAVSLLLAALGTALAQTDAGPPRATLLASVSPAPSRSAAAQADESALRAAVSQAVWPADVVSAADAYLQSFPDDPDVAAQRHAAAQVAALVRRSDVRIFRSSFALPDPALQDDLRRAARGDRAAAVRLAEASVAHDDAHGTQRYVGWMQLAALLGDGQASYRLALHYRRNDQALLAARYEALAVEQGWRPAPTLTQVRK